MVADGLWGSIPMNTRAMRSPFPVSDDGSLGWTCYYQLGSRLWSHALAQHPTGTRAGSEPHHLMVGSPMESVPPKTRTDSVRTPVLPE